MGIEIEVRNDSRDLTFPTHTRTTLRPNRGMSPSQLIFLQLSVRRLIYEFADRVKSTFPALTSAPPIHVLVKGVSPQTALAALTQPSHRPFVISIVCPEVAAFKVNFAVPEAPVVLVGAP